ncbi:MAG: metal ABC transporter substrate-binding protein [Verrucomicrobia bacterium]|nr:metal ABC transporter substrate-binding protein [Verrucomicrobiota bacterium]
MPNQIAKSALLRVFAANYPLAYMVQRIGGHEVEVIFDVPQDTDPAFWKPSDAQITALQEADLIVMNGAAYSKWAEKVTLPESKLVDTSASFRDKFIVVKSTMTHSHGKQGEHSHDGTAFTTWLDFQQAIAQADAICDALKQSKPESVEHFALNFDDLNKDLLALDTRMVAVGKKLAHQPVVASHPVYQYWARRYGINIEAVLCEPEEVPADAQLEDLKKILATHPAKWMVWEGDPAKESVAKIKRLGLDSVVFDPCANRPDKGDFLSVMKENVAAMERMFER